MPLSTWWESVKQRHQHRGVEWKAGEVSKDLIPAPMFDCVLDNLLENASNKRLREPGICIEVSLIATPFNLQVQDTGSAVPEGVARSLLRTVVPSEDGLGVGMYQAARWAQQMGYRLSLKENHEGAVRFELKTA
jgi:K+-sensing histidine kinase KdpD